MEWKGLLKCVNSFGVGPEYLTSVEKRGDGVVRVGNEESRTDNDLVQVNPESRKYHIHNHPLVMINNLTFDQVIKETGEVVHNTTSLAMGQRDRAIIALFFMAAGC
ncbi:hypothetical protein [Niastella koreensis]|nr:hypothetical protein [Niastella koreensis]